MLVSAAIKKKHMHIAEWCCIPALIRYFLFKFEFAFNLLYPRFYLKVLSCDTVVSR